LVAEKKRRQETKSGSPTLVAEKKRLRRKDKSKQNLDLTSHIWCHKMPLPDFGYADPSPKVNKMCMKAFYQI